MRQRRGRTERRLAEIVVAAVLMAASSESVGAIELWSQRVPFFLQFLVHQIQVFMYM
jgi:hypothetical protein